MPVVFACRQLLVAKGGIISICLPIAKKKYDKENKGGYFNNKIIAKGTGLAAQGFIGKKAEGLETFILHINSLSIGSGTIKNIYVEPTQARQSRIGRGLWDYGVVTMDYPRHTFYFTPYAITPKSTIPINFGFRTQQNKSKLTVAIVWNNTQAYSCGLRPGMEIVQLGIFIPKNFTRCDWSKYLKKEQLGSTVLIKFITDKGEIKKCLFKKIQMKTPKP